MATTGKGPFECYTCKNQGFPGVEVYLAGKDEQGRAIRQEADGSPHQHKSKLASSQSQQKQQTIQELKQVAATTTESTDLLLQIKLLHQKMDKVIALLEERLPEVGAVLKNE